MWNGTFAALAALACTAGSSVANMHQEFLCFSHFCQFGLAKIGLVIEPWAVPRSPSALHISIPPFQKGVQLQQLKLGGFCNLPGQFPLPILCGFFLLVATLPFCAASRLAMCFLSIPKTLFLWCCRPLLVKCRRHFRAWFISCHMLIFGGPFQNRQYQESNQPFTKKNPASDPHVRLDPWSFDDRFLKFLVVVSILVSAILVLV